MSLNEQLADRVRVLLASKGDQIEEKKMFGGLCFMVNDKMCVGVGKGRMMVRLGPDRFNEAVEQPGCMPMMHGGRVMNGYVFVDEVFLNTNKQVKYWVDQALDFNKLAKSSKKK
jgi:TfoX/Sxy family transcriptional regulator of competence genes